jgi:hypothetical protein
MQNNILHKILTKKLEEEEQNISQIQNGSFSITMHFINGEPHKIHIDTSKSEKV